MRFDDLLSRADDQALQQLLGGPGLRLLQLLDPSLATPSRLRNLVIELHTRAGLLLDPALRRVCFNLLRPPEAQRLATLLQCGLHTDSYAALQTASIAHGSAREQALFDFFELPLPIQEPHDETSAYADAAAGYPLFAHQRAAARNVKQTLSTEPYRTLLHMPTGAGKTRTAMNVVADQLRAHEPTLIIWLAYSEELCEQAATEFEQAWYWLGNRGVGVHRFWGNRDLDLANLSDGIVVASLTKLYYAAMHDLQILNQLAVRCSLVVIDEAHEAIAPTYRLVLDALVVQRRATGLLGLTATPGRTWNNILADAELAAFFARRKVTLQVEGYANPVEYLVEQGYLAQVQYQPLLAQSGVQLTPTDIRRIETELEIPSSILKRLAEDEQRNLAIIVKAEELARRHKRILIFAASVDHARLLALVLQARGLYAVAIMGTTSSAERVRHIESFKDSNDQTKILCNYGVLTTGFDAPRTSAAIIARPTKSLVLYSQMVGRAIRGVRAGGNAVAEIVTVVDPTLPGFGAVADAFTNWEDVWSNL